MDRFGLLVLDFELLIRVAVGLVKRDGASVTNWKSICEIQFGCPGFARGGFFLSPLVGTKLVSVSV
jgi:hypothetical protein